MSSHFHLCWHRTAHNSSLFAADIGMLLRSPLPHDVCVSLAQPPTMSHQQPCAEVSLASTSLVWSKPTAPQLPLLQLLLPIVFTPAAAPNYVLFSCCSSSASTCYHTHALQSIIITKVAHHCCSPAPRTSHFRYTQTDGQTH